MFDITQHQVYKDYLSADKETRRRIRIALRHAVRDGNYDDDIISLIVTIFSAKRLASFCEKLLLGSNNENEYGERNRGGKVFQVRDILSHYDEIKSKKDGQQCLTDIIKSVNDYEVFLFYDSCMDKPVSYHNAHYINSIYTMLREKTANPTLFANEQLAIDALMQKYPNLDTIDEEVAFQDTYGIPLKDMKAFDSEEFWTKYQSTTGIIQVE